MASEVRSSKTSTSSNAPTMVDQKEFWRGRKKQFGIAVGASFVLIQLLFLTTLCYLFGSIYRQGTRIHNLKVLAVDYDGGIIGQSLRGAYENLAAPSFPGLEFKSTEDGYAEVSDVVEAVRRGDYWAAVYTHAGASTRLSAALAGGDDASTYNSSAAVTYVWNEIRYATVAAGSIKGNMETLISVSRAVYTRLNGTAALSSLAQTDPAAVAAYLNPIQASSINIKPSPQAAKTVYNTIPMVMGIIMQFFFLMAVNGVASSLQLYSHLPFAQNLLVRAALSLVYTLVGALCQSAYFWAFRESREQPGSVFALVWMCLWLYQHVQFLVFDVATTFIPLSFVPFFVLSWVIANVTSTIAPFELAPAFYRWAYALPAHETWLVLMTIWSGGAVNRLYRALPIMFAWVAVMAPCAFVALRWRCKKAVEAAAEEAERKEKERAEIVRKEVGDLQERKEKDRAGHPDADGAASEEMEGRRELEYFPSVPTPFENTLRKVFSA
ncbi:nitrosoguanidine resistance protein sng1 [Diplodia corticola]|uniref:Nitrosoguanidine resistance protein sng1 n=1 Tax=Diplodia corticola TaxID=236234 RepID=A0A1J9RPX4_9PEZI|nr:nitrosoguanidine resistance protein sng1 [Diplodia corticola]OJD29964.1 nitrosoguanidine resistance protein sng1 [Diplodia corticola]